MDESNGKTHAMVATGTSGSYGEHVSFISSSSIKWYTVVPGVENCAGIRAGLVCGSTSGYPRGEKSLANVLVIFGRSREEG